MKAQNTHQFMSAYYLAKKLVLLNNKKNRQVYIIKNHCLALLVMNANQNDTQGIPFSLLDYIELVDWSGRIIREDKRGAISSNGLGYYQH
ncbi:hypothetical protein MT391_03620 [Vibrio sp. 1-Bac 57]